MPARPTTPALRRRALFRLAALGLGGLAAACGRGDSPPRTADPTPGASPGRAARGTPESGSPIPATPSSAERGDSVCLVTKQAGLPAGYVPPDLVTLPARVCASANVRLRESAADSLLKLLDSASDQGFTLFALSGFRSYEEQQTVFRAEVATRGREIAEKQVAPPGHSEHQLGLAVDVTPESSPYELRAEFGREPEGRWLSANAARFGYVISYPREKEAMTGYTYEPWHIRYVGTPLAEQVAASGLSLTEFLPKHNLAGGCPA